MLVVRISILILTQPFVADVAAGASLKCLSVVESGGVQSLGSINLSGIEVNQYTISIR